MVAIEGKNTKTVSIMKEIEKTAKHIAIAKMENRQAVLVRNLRVLK